MTETVYRGDIIEDIIMDNVDEWNSIRWFWNGHEINARDLEMVIYNDEEQQ